MADLIGVVVGGLVGFLSAYGMEELKRRAEKKEDCKRIARLTEILYEEVEQLAELLAVDLAIVDSDELGFILDYGRGTEEYDGKINAVIGRLRENTRIYDSQASSLLGLPGYLPNAMVRFYSRLEVNCGKMGEAVIRGDASLISELRQLLLVEAEVLKGDLKKAKDEACAC